MNTNHIGLQIGIYRRAKGLTQEELAQRSGVHYNTIVKLENLTKPANPTIMTLQKIAESLEVEIEIIMGTRKDVKIAD